jgi:hypothetical protein
MALLSLSCVKRHEDWLKAEGVSVVARSPRGFLTAYKKAGSYSKLSPKWKRRRDGFIARHMAQVEKNREPLRKNGKLTRRAGALIAWAYFPGNGCPMPNR